MTEHAGAEVGADGAPDDRPRCGWARGALDVAYHDAEWGVPVRDDDRRLFEMITLEGAQAGLSWATILKKRDGYRRAFHDFDPARVARMTARDVERLLADPGIVRHRGKIESTIQNAGAVMRVQRAHGSLSTFVWDAVGGAVRTNRWQDMREVPAQTPESVALGKALLEAGFRFVGPTTCYAFMQAVGIVNDHLVTCFRHGEV